MPALTYAQILADLDLITGDESGKIWTAAQKQSAIDKGIDDLWPEIKDTGKDSAKAIVAGTTVYTYTYNATTLPLTEWGIGQVFADKSPTPGTSPEELVLIRSAAQRQVGADWELHIPDDISRLYDAKKFVVKYHKRFPRLGGTGSLNIPSTDPIIFRAAYVLSGRITAQGMHLDARTFAQLRNEHLRDWMAAKQQFLVMPMSVAFLGLRPS